MRKFMGQLKGKHHKKEDERPAARPASQLVKSPVQQAVTTPTAVTAHITASNNTRVSENVHSVVDTHSNAQLEPYTYERLFHNDVHDNIRIFVLQPGTKDSAISGTIQYAPLSRRPSYECLSYAWGDPSPKTRILCDDKSLEITSNLKEALRVLRYAGKPRKLWIDQICINQQDVRERNIQVLRMAGIFSTASSVLLYLGTYGPSGASAYELIHSMCLTMGKVSLNNADSFHKDRQTRTVEYYVNQYNLPPPTSPKWSAIAELFTSRVFRRTWILQEIVLARRLHVFWDEFSLPWEQIDVSSYQYSNFGLFINLIAILSRTWPQGTIAPNLVRHAEFLSDCLLIRHQTRKVGRLSLPLMLERTRSWESTDPRDKIFGVLCIVSGGDLLGLPNYQWSLEYLYTQTARRIAEHAGSLRHLHYVEVGFSLNDDRRELPSWVPDWRKISTTGYHGDMYSDLPQYRPALGSKPVVQPMKEFKKLELRGLLVDTVKTVISSEYRKDGLFASHGKWWDLANSVAEGGIYSPTREKMEVALARTRVVDCWPGSERYVAPSTTLQSSSPGLSDTLPPVQQNEPAEPYWPRLFSHVTYMTVFKGFGITCGGYIAMLPEKTKEGDKVVAFLGGDEPFVVREVKDGEHRLIGSCYVHGIMDGELFAPATRPTPEDTETIAEGQVRPRKGALRDWVLV